MSLCVQSGSILCGGRKTSCVIPPKVSTRYATALKQPKKIVQNISNMDEIAQGAYLICKWVGRCHPHNQTLTSIKMKRKPVYDMTSPAYECDSCEKCTLFKMIG